MFSENTILCLQIFAAFFMGYDYFVTEKFKDEIDGWASNLSEEARNRAITGLKEKVSKLRKQAGLVYFILIFGLGLLVTKLGMGAFSTTNNAEVYLVIGFVWLFFVAGLGFAIINKLIPEHLIPIVAQFGKVSLFSFLRYSPKGAVASLGMVFLITSFICRYINYNYGI